ncbi:MAG: hypothetical protein ABL959_18235, partial [Pyrinomonadaceae bacterium]
HEGFDAAIGKRAGKLPAGARLAEPWHPFQGSTGAPGPISIQFSRIENSGSTDMDQKTRSTPHILMAVFIDS